MFHRFRGVTADTIEKFFGRKVLGRDLSEFAVLLFIIVYGSVFSYFTILKYEAFTAYAWDLGIFDQALWTTIHDGKLFYFTVELFINPSGSFFGSHFSPILFLVLPFYALHPGPQTLLVFQSFILALGAIPLYFYTKDTIGHKTAAVGFSLAYLAYTPLQGVNWFDFHVQSFLPLFLFSAMYFLKKEKWLPYFAFIFLALSVEEHVPLVVAFIGIYCFWFYRKGIIQAVKSKRLSDKRVLVPFVTVIVAGLWLFLALWIQNTYFPIDPDYSRVFRGFDNFSVLGIQDNPMSLPFYILLHPLKVLDALIYDVYMKLLYIIFIFGPLYFLSFKSTKTIIVLVWLVPAFLSNYSPYYSIGTQYPAYIIAFIFLAAVDVIGVRTIKYSNGKSSPHIKNIVILGLLFLIFTSPLTPLLTAARTYPTPFFSAYRPPSITYHEVMLQRVADVIPANASVLTQNNLFPHFSSRINAYVYPVQIVLDRAPVQKMNQYLNYLTSNSEYVLVDAKTDSYTTTEVVLRMQRLPTHGLYVYIDGIYLFKKGYSGSPVFPLPGGA